MKNRRLTDKEADLYEASGVGRVPAGEDEDLRVWVVVRADRELASFDAVTDFAWHAVDGDQFAASAESLGRMVENPLGLLVEDVWKILDRDIDKRFIAAMKKAILQYLMRNGQIQRVRQLSENLVCRCFHVTDQDLLDLKKKHGADLEKIQKISGAGTGCESCINRVMDILEL